MRKLVSFALMLALSAALSATVFADDTSKKLCQRFYWQSKSQSSNSGAGIPFLCSRVSKR